MLTMTGIIIFLVILCVSYFWNKSKEKREREIDEILKERNLTDQSVYREWLKNDGYSRKVLHQEIGKVNKILEKEHFTDLLKREKHKQWLIGERYKNRVAWEKYYKKAFRRGEPYPGSGQGIPDRMD